MRLCDCSCSYSEQYLQNYFGHSGPLYQIQWSPFARGLFLSASADWTVKLWAEENPTALITFQVTTFPRWPRLCFDERAFFQPDAGQVGGLSPLYSLTTHCARAFPPERRNCRHRLGLPV